MRHIDIALLPLLGLAASAGLAHHSRANFQLDNLVEMRGTVTEFNWSYPHIYWRMEMENGEDWLIEGHNPPGALRLGWTRDTLEVGDELLIAGFPDHDPDRKFALIEYLVMADGTPMAGFNAGAIPVELRAGAGAAPARGSEPGPIKPSADFSGNWRPDLTGQNLRTGARFEPAAGLPLTEAGEAVMAAYDEAENPSYQCLQGSLPFTAPSGIRFDRHADRLAIELEAGGGDRTYTIWLDESAAPVDRPPSRLGVAVGRMEDDRTIVFEVTNYVADKWGLGRGLDSSDRKHVSGRLALHPDCLSVDYSFVLSDPVYLTEPITRSGILRKQPDRVFSNEPCDPEISSLHLDFE